MIVNGYISWERVGQKIARGGSVSIKRSKVERELLFVIRQCNGGYDFAKERRRLCMGVRKVCHTLLENNGAFERNFSDYGEAPNRKLVGGNVSEAIVTKVWPPRHERV